MRGWLVGPRAAAVSTARLPRLFCCRSRASCRAPADCGWCGLRLVSEAWRPRPQMSQTKHCSAAGSQARRTPCTGHVSLSRWSTALAVECYQHEATLIVCVHSPCFRFPFKFESQSSHRPSSTNLSRPRLFPLPTKVNSIP